MSAGAVLSLYREGRISAEVAIARLLLAGLSPGEIAAEIAGDVSPRAAALLTKLQTHRPSLERLRGLFAAIDHESPPSGIPAIRVMFDRAVTLSPEASVAAYSLGDPAILAAATAELLEWLGSERLISSQMDVIDLGCGFGRVAAALAPRVRSVLGLDVSPAMIDAARRRHRAANLRFAVTEGVGLGDLLSDAFELVLAVDSFPYLMQAGPDIADRHVADASRVLRRGGALVILNISYRGEPAADAAEAERWANTYRMQLRINGATPFKLWDGRAFVLGRP